MTNKEKHLRDQIHTLYLRFKESDSTIDYEALITKQIELLRYQSAIRPQDVEKYLKTTNSNPSKPRIRSQHLSREALEEHCDTTVGLWVIDRDPREVSKEWIDENAYQIMGLVTTENGL